MSKRLGLSAAILLATCACQSKTSDFEIINGSRNSVFNLTVSDNEKLWRLGNLKPGQSAHFRDNLHGEGGVDISWTIAGHRFKDKGCYHTSGAPAKGQLVITGNSLRFHCL